MKINSERIWRRIQQLGEIGATKDGGVTRFAFSTEDIKATDLVMEWMKEAGLAVTTDAIGNVFGRRHGKTEGLPVLTGSHLDSVPNGGKFDGVAGVITALESLQVLHENQIETQLPIEMVIFVSEEGSRFPGGLMGSMALAGSLLEDIIHTLKDDKGTTLKEALEDFGAQPEKLAEARRSKNEFTAFYELHIEQAEVLEYRNVPVGIVTGIAGPYQMTVHIFGRSGHAGATPMGLRKDPMVAAGMIIQEVERSAIEEGSTIRGTVGYLRAYPGAHNVIPEKVELTLDYRDIHPENRLKAVQRIRKYITDICQERGLESEIITNIDTPPTILDERIIRIMEETAKEIDISAMTLPSGAAHDAMIMHSLCPTGMIFVRSRDGLSHCPAEFTTQEDLEQGATLLLHTLVKTANGALK